MPKKATTGTNLVDQLLPLADDLRSSLYADFGVRQYKVTIVRRKWSGTRRGEGTVSVVSEVEIDPAPEVRFTGAGYASRVGGHEDVDKATLFEVSLLYSEAELTGQPIVENEEVYYRIQENQGQKSATRYYMLDGVPDGDRQKTIGWIVPLRSVEIQE